MDPQNGETTQAAPPPPIPPAPPAEVTFAQIMGEIIEEEEKVKEVKAKAKGQTYTRSGFGRPTVMTKDTLQKLRQAFLMGFNDEESCAYANIAPQTLYNYQEKNPDFLEYKEVWKQNPILKAKAVLYNSLSKTDTAQWYLERKLKGEFALRQEITGANGDPVHAILEKLETNYDDVADKARAAIDAAAKPAVEAAGQVVEAQPPVQDQNQTGQSSNIPPEHNTTETPSTETQPPVQPDPQG